MRFLPTFFFGDKFRRAVEKGRRLREDMLEIPYRDTELQKVTHSKQSMVSATDLLKYFHADSRQPGTVTPRAADR